MSKQMYLFQQKKLVNDTIKRYSKHNQTSLSKQVLDEIDQYCIENFGSRKYRHWLKFYTLVNNGEFKKGWLPSDYYYLEVLPYLNHHYKYIAQVKTLSARIIGNQYLPDKFYFINGQWYDVYYKKVDKNKISDFLTTSPLFYKLDDSNRGKGVYKLDSTNFHQMNFEKLGSGVLQEAVRQHSFFDQFNPDNVATIRMTTVLNELGEPSIKGSYLRIGRKKETHVQAHNSIRVSINKDGLLSKECMDADWIRYPSHPDSGASFEGKIIPHYQDAVTIIMGMHKQIPNFRIIGWDIAIDVNGEVKILEYNTNHPAIRYSEASDGPHYYSLIEEMNKKGEQNG